jgi:hypothetical protein
LAEKDQRVKAVDRPGQAAAYSDLAVRSLRAAVSKEYSATAELKTAKKFEVLHQRGDFPAIVRELEAAAAGPPRAKQ